MLLCKPASILFYVPVIGTWVMSKAVRAGTDQPAETDARGAFLAGLA
jgi:hypothetical protein